MKTKIIAIALILICNFYHAKAQEQVVAVATGGVVVKDILNKFMQDAQLLLNQANSDGNALLSRMGNELNVSVQNANLLLSDDMDKAFNKLDDQSSKILASIDQIRMTALGISKTAY